ncbi:MAG: SLBB domain-containing protein [Candidatus Obscuribacterales bacterium]|nr:SLBB domain-containing protein [Candidatus Obscuribacterales bacterium]
MITVFMSLLVILNPYLAVMAQDSMELKEPPIKIAPLSIGAPQNAASDNAASGGTETSGKAESDFEKSEDEYVLGPGDEITVMDPSLGIDGQPYVNTSVIGPDGMITIYPVGLIKAAGKTLRQLTQEVDKKSEVLLKKPEMVLVLSKTRPIEVYVLGDVLNPGLYRSMADQKDQGSSDNNQGQNNQTQQQSLSMLGTGGQSGGGGKGGGGQTMLLQNYGSLTPESKPGPTTLTALTAIQQAGGVRETADIRHIRVRRGGSKKIINFNLEELLINGDESQDVLLQPGDTVMVPRGGEDFAAEYFGLAAHKRRVVRIFGSVKFPGVYALQPNDDVLSVIARAGGFSDDAYTWRVTLSRVDRKGHFVARKISVKKSIKDQNYIGRVPLASGDVVQVHANYIKKVSPRASTIAATFASAFFILFLSRRIVDQSNPNTNNSSLNSNNAGPLGLPSVF